MLEVRSYLLYYFNKNDMYYYLVGQDKIGPFSKDEILSMKLSKGTLVYSPELDKWVPFTDIRGSDVKEENTPSKRLVKDEALFLYSIVIIFVLFAISIIIAYMITNNQVKRDYHGFVKKVEGVFGNDTSVYGFNKTNVTGDLSRFGGWSDSRFFNDNKGKGKEIKDVLEYYSCTSGGWSIYTLTRTEGGYDLTIQSSTDMGFKVPVLTADYYISTELLQSTIQSVYNDSFYFALSESEETPSHINHEDISLFHTLKSQFYYIGDRHPQNNTGVSNEAAERRSFRDSFVFSDYWIVWSKTVEFHFNIVMNQKEFHQLLNTNIGIGAAVAFVLFLPLFFMMKIYRKKRLRR